MTRIKLCGLRTPADIRAANALRPDFVGFVFAPASRRAVTPAVAARLRQFLSPGIRAVGVFVRAQPEAAAHLANAGVIDLIQLHGGEDAAYLERLRALTGAPVIQAFRMDDPRQAAQAGQCRADFLLLDSGPGGTGTAFDWRAVPALATPYFLAGGLTPGNVGAAIRRLHPYGVDVSSGIETDGAKDAEKMAAFVAAVRKEDAV